MNKITPNMLPAFQGIIPPTLATSSIDGIPNITYISHVHYIDENHVALSRQFFNKTWKNIKENPYFTVAITCPETSALWKINLRFIEERREGTVFDEIDMVLTAIASSIGIADLFKLDAAVICEVTAIKTIFESNEN